MRSSFDVERKRKSPETNKKIRNGTRRVLWNKKQYWYDIFHSFILINNIFIFMNNIFILIFKIMKYFYFIFFFEWFNFVYVFKLQHTRWCNTLIFLSRYFRTCDIKCHKMSHLLRFLSMVLIFFLLYLLWISN